MGFREFIDLFYCKLFKQFRQGLYTLLDVRFCLIEADQVSELHRPEIGSSEYLRKLWNFAEPLHYDQLLDVLNGEANTLEVLQILQYNTNNPR
jgi:hypothetical protein